MRDCRIRRERGQTAAAEEFVLSEVNGEDFEVHAVHEESEYTRENGGHDSFLPTGDATALQGLQDLDVNDVLEVVGVVVQCEGVHVVFWE